MSANNEGDPTAYNEVMERKAAQGHQLFELLVWDNWLGSLSVALRGSELGDSGQRYTYHDSPTYVVDLENSNYNYIGGSTLQQAKKYKAEALGEEVDDDRLKELVEELLAEELEKYQIKLEWIYRHAWDGTDRLLVIHPIS